MKDDRVLIKLDRAHTLLSEAKTLQDVKQVIALADAARVYAKRISASQQTTNSAAEFRLRAERHLGEMIARAPKQAGARGIGKSGVPKKNPTPTLAESGIDKKTSSRAQQLAAVPAREFEQALQVDGDLNPNRVVRDLTQSRQKQSRDKKRRDAIASTEPQFFDNVHVGDFREQSDKIADGSISLIFTDPPYDRESLALMPELAAFANQKLCDGGSLLCYVGHVQLVEALNAFSEQLRYWWCVCCVHSGGNSLMREYGIRVGWKPILWFVKGTRDDKSTIVRDVVSGGTEKTHHDWQQAQSEAEYWIENLCPTDGIVLDPFLGGGTTVAAAIKLKRQWVACEKDHDQAVIAMARIKGSNAA